MLIYRSLKGAPLTSEEVDGNFKDLATRLDRLETAPLDAEGLAAIHLDQGELRFQGTRGTFFGAFSLPKLCWNPRGAWDPNLSYAPLDVVAYHNALYVCKQAHTRGSEFVDAGWSLLFSFPQHEEHKQIEQTLPNPAENPARCLATPLGKADLPKDPPVGTLVLLLDAAEHPELIYWEGERWRRIGNGLVFDEQ